MSKLKKIRNTEQYRSLVQDNEENANRCCAVTIVMSAVLLILHMIFVYSGKTGYSYSRAEYHLILFFICICLICVTLCFFQKFRHTFHKFLLLGSLLLGSMVMYATEGIIGRVFLMIPLVLVGLYHEEKYCIAVLCWSVINVLAGTQLYILIDRAFYASKENVTFAGAMFGSIIPSLLFVGAFSYISFRIARTGKHSTEKLTETAVSLALKDQEMEMGAQLQNSVFPTNFDLNGNGAFELFADILPAREVAGDFYDFFLSEKKLVLLIADVSDKGLASALYMMSARNTIRSLYPVLKDPVKVFNEANKILCETSGVFFVTALIASIDTETGTGEFVNAGHMPPAILHDNGTVGFLEKEPQPILGVFPEVEYTSAPVHLGKNDALVLYTDGVTEAENSAGEAYGTGRVKETLRQRRGESPKQILEAFLKDLNAFKDESRLSDDSTMLILKWRGDSNAKQTEAEYSIGKDTCDEAMRQISQALKDGDCPDETRQLILSACDDLLSNILEHSGADRLTVRTRVCPHCARIRLLDNGQPFDLSAGELEPIIGLQEGGMGLHLIRAIFDEAAYVYEDGNRNTLTKYW